jgi:hypothetical protein
MNRRGGKSMKAAIFCGSLATVLLVFGSSTSAADLPPLVAAYAAQIVRQCGPAPAGTEDSLVQRIDLDRDGIDDWVIDAGRRLCPGRPALAVAAGAPVTVFRGLKSGQAVPVFQRAAFGTRLVSSPSGERALWITLGGRDCGESSETVRCEREVTWQSSTQRLETASAKPPRQGKAPPASPQAH